VVTDWHSFASAGNEFQMNAAVRENACCTVLVIILSTVNIEFIVSLHVLFKDQRYCFGQLLDSGLSRLFLSCHLMIMPMFLCLTIQLV